MYLLFNNYNYLCRTICAHKFVVILYTFAICLSASIYLSIYLPRKGCMCACGNGYNVLIVFSAILLITSDQLVYLVQNFLDNITMDIGFPGFQNDSNLQTSSGKARECVYTTL